MASHWWERADDEVVDVAIAMAHALALTMEVFRDDGVECEFSGDVERQCDGEMRMSLGLEIFGRHKMEGDLEILASDLRRVAGVLEAYAKEAESGNQY